MKNIIIADDHSIVRQGLKRILSQNDSYCVVGEAASVSELRVVLRAKHADVLILDLVMPGGVGMEVIKEIKFDYPKLPVLILSFYGEDLYGVRAFSAGATGYLNKECAPEQLVEALGELIAGKRYFSKRTQDMILNEFQNKKLQNKSASKFPHYDLSDRELHVLIMLGHGIALTRISSNLSLSAKTVSTYRQRVLKKMKMTTNAQLVRYVILHGDSIDQLSL